MLSLIPVFNMQVMKARARTKPEPLCTSRKDLPFLLHSHIAALPDVSVIQSPSSLTL